MSAKIIPFRPRQVEIAKENSSSYADAFSSMNKWDLLEEMVRFQEERSRVGYLTLNMINRGIPLFKALEESAETPELKTLAQSYRRHLECEKEARK